VRILATLGPASDTPEMIRQLAEAGADAFRINMSHGSHEDHARRIAAIRHLEAELERPTTIVADLQGPKLRVGRFEGDKALLKKGQTFVFDRDKKLGDSTRANLPHREIFEAVQPGARLLVDDGKLVFRIVKAERDRLETKVEVGGTISNNKGLNLPDVLLPMAALTEKDRKDLAFALEHGVDWIALSFVQRPETSPRRGGLIGGKAAFARQDREAGRDRAARRHIGAGRRGDGGARRPRRRDAARRGAAAAEKDRRGGAPARPAGGGGDPDARIDDQHAVADPRRGVRRRHRRL
jgi:pyruvate kinase